MDYMPEVSVIMLVYNREQWVERAVSSIINQTYKDFELIIIDNGSSDGSKMIVENLAKNDDRIRFVSIPKSSISVGRNTGLDMAKGRYITFVDDDDVSKPSLIESLVRELKENDADISLCGSLKNVNGEELPNCVIEDKLVMGPEEAVVTLLKRKKYNAAMPTKMLKRELFDQIRFIEKGKYDDIAVVYRYFVKAKKTVAFGDPLYTFYRHENNNSAFTTNDKLLTPEQLDEYLEAFKERTRYISKELPNIADYALYSEWSYMISMVNKIVSNDLENCRNQLLYMKRVLKNNYNEFWNSPYIEEFEREWMTKYIGEIFDDLH